MTDLILKVHNNSTYIIGKVDKNTYKDLKEDLGYMPDDSIFRVRNSKIGKDGKPVKSFYKNGDWDGRVTSVCYSRKWCKCHVKKDGTHFPTGLLSKARSVFDRHDITYVISDCRIKTPKNISLEMSDDFETRDYQADAVDKAVKQKRGIIKAATGSGKTSIAAKIIKEIAVSPTAFYVTSIDLLMQAQSEFQKFLIQNGSPLKVGAIGGGMTDLQDITVMTVQSAIRALDVKYKKADDEDKDDKTDISSIKDDIKDFIINSKLMLCDEVQHWSAETCQVISDASEKCYYRFGLSATPFRDLGDDILIDACFGKVISDISASFLIRKNYLVKPEIYFVPIPDGSLNFTSYAEIYKSHVVENEYRNNCIKNIAKSMEGEGRTILILCKHIEHGKTLAKLIDGSVFLHGTISKKNRLEHLEKIRNQKAPITIASSIFDEGVDVKPLDTLILAGSGKSSTRALQRIGRVLRKYTSPSGVEKTGAVVVDFADQCKYMNKHSRARRKIYMTEEEFDVKDMSL